MEQQLFTEDPRGTKRTCQSNQCGERFYDLNRDPIVCPICGTSYVIASAPPRWEEAVEPKPVAPVEESTEAVADDGAEVISLEDADAEVGGDDADDTFLEESDDSNDDVDVIVSTEGTDEED